MIAGIVVEIFICCEMCGDEVCHVYIVTLGGAIWSGVIISIYGYGAVVSGCLQCSGYEMCGALLAEMGCDRSGCVEVTKCDGGDAVGSGIILQHEFCGQLCPAVWILWIGDGILCGGFVDISIYCRGAAEDDLRWIFPGADLLEQEMCLHDIIVVEFCWILYTVRDDVTCRGVDYGIGPEFSHGLEGDG